LEAAPEREMQVAVARYAQLQADADSDGRLARRIEKERRAELADFGQARMARVAETLLHDATWGMYTHRTRKGDVNLVALDCERRIQYRLNFLDSLVQAGTPPEIAYDSARIKAAVGELSGLVSSAMPNAVRVHAAATIERVSEISRDEALRSDCSLALAELKRDTGPVRAALVSGMAASPHHGSPAQHVSVAAAVK
jgi:hypothetical protein